MNMLPPFLLTVVSVFFMLLFGHMGWGSTGVFKMYAATGFVAMALAAGALQYPYGRAVLVALVFSWFGDFFLIYSADTIFLMGLVAFLIGHLGFAAAFLVHGVCLRWTGLAALALLVPAGIVTAWLWPHAGDMLIPVLAYIVVITAMVALAFGALGRGAVWVVVLAAIMFFVSDIFVARARFVTSSPWNGLIGLPLYFGAQVLFAYTVALMHPDKRAARQTAPAHGA